VRPDLGDAGELLDATAKAAYKARLGELAAELEEAERCSDPGRAAKASTERDFLVGELPRAVGLGGRDRRAASHAGRSARRWPTSPAPTRPWAGTLRPRSARAGTAPTPPTPAPRSPGNSDPACVLQRAVINGALPLNTGAHPLNAPDGEDAQTRRNKRRPARPRAVPPINGSRELT
jgi:hypothetical protein